MYRFVATCSLFLIILSGYLMPLHAVTNNQNAVAQQYAPPQGQPYPVPPSYYGTQSEYYYNQGNPYLNSTNNMPPPAYNNYGFYGGFYGSPPPPTPAQAFPDKAASDNLYRYIQSR